MTDMTCCLESSRSSCSPENGTTPPAVQPCVSALTTVVRVYTMQSVTEFSGVSMSNRAENLDKAPIYRGNRRYPGAETTCCMSKMPLTENHCDYRLSVLAHNGVCGERAKNALLRTKTLGFRRIEAIALEAPQ